MEILKVSLEKWGKNNEKYRKLYKDISKGAKSIAFKFFEESPIIKPGSYEIWWATNHNRFIKDVKQRELNLLHEILYNFLSEFARGELGKYEAPAKTRATKA